MYGMATAPNKSNVVAFYFQLLSNLHSISFPIKKSTQRVNVALDPLYQLHRIDVRVPLSTKDDDIDVCQVLHHCDANFYQNHSSTPLAELNKTKRKMLCANNTVGAWTSVQRVAACRPLTCCQCQRPHKRGPFKYLCRAHLGFFVCEWCCDGANTTYTKYTKSFCQPCANLRLPLKMIVEASGLQHHNFPSALKVCQRNDSQFVGFRAPTKKGTLITFSHTASVVEKRGLGSTDRLLHVANGEFVKKGKKPGWIFALPFTFKPNCELTTSATGLVLQLKVLCDTARQNCPLQLPVCAGRNPAMFPFNVKCDEAGPLLTTAKRSKGPNSPLAMFLKSLPDSYFVRFAAACEVMVQSKTTYTWSDTETQHVHWLADAALVSMLRQRKPHNRNSIILQTVDKLQSWLPNSGACTLNVLPKATIMSVAPVSPNPHFNLNHHTTTALADHPPYPYYHPTRKLTET